MALKPEAEAGELATDEGFKEVYYQEAFKEYKKADLNGDGRVSREEFAVMTGKFFIGIF